jgi:phosphate:Na+ symporter
MSALETIITMIAGIGLFFSGIKILSSSMKNLATHEFRLLIAKWTNNPFLAAFWGFLSGAITQSSSNTVFILVGLVKGGLISVRKALPVIVWSSIGTALLIFIVAINIKLGILILVGFSGILFGFDKGSKKENLYAALFGISLLLFGFSELKSGSQPLAQMDSIKYLFAYAKDSFIISFFIGAFLRFIIHSSTTITVLIMTISHAGLIGLDQVIVMIFSIGIGEAVSLYFLSSGVKGVAKELVIFKIIESIATSLLLVTMSFIEWNWHIPLIKNLVLSLGSNLEQQTAFAFLIARVVPVLFFPFLYDMTYRLLIKISPPTVEENMSGVHFISEQSLTDVSTALILVEKEQFRIFERFAQYIDNIRTEMQDQEVCGYHIIRNSNAVLLKEIDVFLKRIIDLNLSYSNSEIYILLQKRQANLKSIDDAAFDFVDSVSQNRHVGGGLDELIQNSAESLHLNFITAFEATQSKDPLDISLLLSITADKGPLMEKIRKFHLEENSDLSQESKAVILYMTELFQRTVWLIHSWAKGLKTDSLA